MGDVAIVVAHDDHQRGVGTALLKHLDHVARKQGLQRFVADVLSSNYLMLKVLSDAGWPTRRLTDGTVTHLEIDLAAAGEG